MSFPRRSSIPPILSILLFVMGLMLSVTTADAAFQISRSVIGNGAAPLSGGEHSLNGTVGQAAIGILSGPTHEHRAGFWYCGATATSVQEAVEVPSSFALRQNCPNPFNPTTTIRYDLPEASEMRLSIYDVQGRLATTLVQGLQPAGYHEILFRAKRLPSGIYFCRMEAGSFVATHKLVLLK